MPGPGGHVTAAPAGPSWSSSTRTVPQYMVAQFAMTCATVAGVTALGKQVYDLTARELDLGLLGLAEFAPAALLVFVTGPVADRFDRRVVAASGAATVGGIALVLALLANDDSTTLGAILATVVA